MLTEKQQQQKAELINELIATITVMEEIYKYHPDNDNRVDIVKEYENLIIIKDEVESELEEFEED